MVKQRIGTVPGQFAGVETVCQARMQTSKGVEAVESKLLAPLKISRGRATEQWPTIAISERKVTSTQRSNQNDKSSSHFQA